MFYRYKRIYDRQNIHCKTGHKVKVFYSIFLVSCTCDWGLVQAVVVAHYVNCISYTFFREWRNISTFFVIQ